MELELFKELYRESWSRRDQLVSEIGTPVGILTFTGGILVYLVKNFFFRMDICTLLFLLLVAGAIWFYFWAVVYLVRSYHGYLYETIPAAGELKDYYDKLVSAYASAGHSPDKAKSRFEEMLCRKLAQATDRNMENNESRSAFLHRMKRSLVFMLCLIAICSLPWVVNRVEYSKSPQPDIKKCLCGTKGAQEMSDEKDKQDSQPQPRPEEPKPEPTKTPLPEPPLPPEPENRLIREGEQPAKRTDEKIEG